SPLRRAAEAPKAIWSLAGMPPSTTPPPARGASIASRTPSPVPAISQATSTPPPTTRPRSPGAPAAARSSAAAAPERGAAGGAGAGGGGPPVRQRVERGDRAGPGRPQHLSQQEPDRAAADDRDGGAEPDMAEVECVDGDAERLQHRPTGVGDAVRQAVQQ